MKRNRKAKIVATLGPASSTPGAIRALFNAGADVFRFNFSHGAREDHQRRYDIVREVERETGRPIAVLGDLQGPKLRVGTFAEGKVALPTGGPFRLDMDASPGDASRVGIPYPEVFAALKPGVQLLLDNGKIRLLVEACGTDAADTRIVAGGALSDRKGVSVIGALLPVSSAIDWLEEIVRLSDGLMLARGDLGVEMRHEQVPVIQRRILRECRTAGKPVSRSSWPHRCSSR